MYCANCGAHLSETPNFAPDAAQNPAHYTQPGSEPLSIGQYIGMFLLMLIPIANVILLLVWGFGGSLNLNKRNFARAALILCAVMFILSFGLGLLIIPLLTRLPRV